MGFRKIYILSICLLSVFSILTASAGGAAERTINLKYSHFVPTTSIYHKLIKEWASEVEKRTNGRVRITIYGGGTLLKGPETYDGVISGVADIGWVVPQYTRGRFPLIAGMELPLGFSSAEVASKVGWDLFKKFKPKEFSQVKVLYFHAAPPRQLHTKKAVRTLEDFADMECGASGSEEIVKLLGAIPVSVPVSQSYEQLSKGMLQGVLASADTLRSFRLYEVTGHTTIVNLGSAAFVQVMNLQVWNSLPKDIQKIIDQLDDEWVGYTGREWDKGAQASIAFAKQKGQEIITPGEKELERWQERVRPVQESFIRDMNKRGLPGKEFVDEALRLKERYQK